MRSVFTSPTSRWLILGLSVVLLAACSYPMNGKSGASYDDIITSSVTNLTSETGTYAYREMIVHMPTGGKRPTRAVVFFHGILSGAADMERVSTMDAQADANGYMIVYAGSAEPDNSFNAGGAFGGQATAAKIDDEGYGLGIINELRDLGISVWGLGFSNGAMLIYRIACDHPALLPVIGSMSGTLETTGCTGAGQFKALEIHGTNDTTVPLHGPAIAFGGGLINSVDYLLATTGSSVTLEQVVNNDPNGHAWAAGAAADFNNWFMAHPTP